MYFENQSGDSRSFLYENISLGLSDQYIGKFKFCNTVIFYF